MIKKHCTRRDFLKTSALVTGAVFTAPYFLRAAAPADESSGLNAFRAKFGGTPIQSTKLTDSITLLSGPGGNVAVLNGGDGKIVIDTFVQPAWENLKKSLADIGPQPIKLVIDTHWHFDHADNNGAFRAMGAPILAHKNVVHRMSESHELSLFHLHVPASPASALPTQTFSSKHSLSANGEKLLLQHVDPAHTDTDIFIHFEKANIIHCGDLVTNHGGFPFIDFDTGGKIAGMIKASAHFLKIADDKTRFIPGHGGMVDKPTLQKFHDMLVQVHDRIAPLKGKSLEEVKAVKPLADLAEQWGKGMLNADQYTEDVYRAL